MKTRLLKIIRKDRRYSIEHRHHIEGYPYSGWWYLIDHKSLKHSRNKKLIEIVKLYLFFMVAKRKILLSKFIVFVSALIIFLLLYSCKEERIEIWNPYTSDVSNDSLSDTIDINEKMMLMELEEK